MAGHMENGRFRVIRVYLTRAELVVVDVDMAQLLIAGLRVKYLQCRN